jgi:hypothetical protein
MGTSRSEMVPSFYDGGTMKSNPHPTVILGQSVGFVVKDQIGFFTKNYLVLGEKPDFTRERLGQRFPGIFTFIEFNSLPGSLVL